MLPKKPPLFKCPVQFVATQGRCGNTQSLTFIVKGQVLSSSEKGPFQLDDYFVSFRILLHSWAPFFYAASVYKTCMQSHYIHAAHSVHAHTHTHTGTHSKVYIQCSVLHDLMEDAGWPLSCWSLIKFKSSRRLWQWPHATGRREGRPAWMGDMPGWEKGKKGAGSKGWEREL